MQSLLYNFLNEWLAVFTTEDFIVKDVKIIDFDANKFKLTAQG